MLIKVDNREQDLLKQIQNLVLFIPAFKQLKVETAALPLGDIIIYDDNDEKLIIERKCLNDLLASIKDGRYEEQSYRLNGLNHPNHNIYYLIEGDVNKANRFKDNNIEKLTLYSAMFSLNYYKGFSVMRTLSMEETAIFICNTANKLSKSDKKAYYENKPQVNTVANVITSVITSENGEDNLAVGDKNLAEEKNLEKESDKDYISVVKKVKKENITPENIAEIMLCQIPGISSVTAIAIMDKFKTIPNLINEIQQNDNCLKDISYQNSKGQSRKINKTSLVNIVKFLLKK
jgi:crossover junction endonuclease MUS81